MGAAVRPLAVEALPGGRRYCNKPREREQSAANGGPLSLSLSEPDHMLGA